MVKYLKTGKRIITLALSATLILGEASVSFAAPRVNFDQTIDVIEESDTTGAFTPGKVTNVGFKSYNATGVIDDKRVSWNAVQGANSYQYRITDAAGKEYVPNLAGYDKTKKVYTYLDYNQTSNLYLELYNFGFSQIQAKDGGYVYSKDAAGNKVNMKSGTKYNFQVRAVRYGQDDDTYGPWSDPVSFTTKKMAADKVTDFNICQNYYGYYAITYSSTDMVEMEIKDAAGNYYYDNVYDEYDDNGNFIKTVYQYETLSKCAPGETKELSDVFAYIFEKNAGDKNYSTKKDKNGNSIRSFKVGETYSIRLRGFDYDDKGEKKVSDWTQALTVKVPVKPIPEKPGNLDYYYDGNGGQIYWSRIPNASFYEFELKDAEGKIYTYYGYPTVYDDYLYLKNLKQSTKGADGRYTEVKDAKGNPIYAGIPGKKYTLRVRSANTKDDYDYDIHAYPTQYSAWSDTFTFTVPAEKNVDPAKVKVTGLRYSKDSKCLYWEKPDDLTGLREVRYEVELKDNFNRTYGMLYAEGGGHKLGNYITDDNSAKDIKTYVKIDDKYEQVIDQNGDKILAFREGFKYTARVRMIAWTGDSDADKYGAWSDAYTFTVPVTTASSGINSKPAKVTGVWVKTEPSENDTLYGPILYWNKIDKANYYEIELKDAAGNVFLRSAEVIDGKLIPNYYTSYYQDSNSAYLSSMIEMQSYKKVDGSALTCLRDSKGDIVNPFINGQTYTFRVRAVNEYYKKNSDGSTSPKVQYVGDWSDPVTYTAANRDLKVKTLKYVKSDEDYYYFAVDGDQKYSRLYYQVASDASFSNASILFGWYSIYDSEASGYSFVIPKRYFDELKTYHIRVVNSRYGDPDDVKAYKSVNIYNSVLATAATTSFKTDADKKPAVKNITNLKIYNETKDYYNFRFDAKLNEKDGDGFVVEINNVNNAANGNWSRLGYYTKSQYEDYDFSVSKSSLLDGVNYIRVRAYNYVKDKETGKSTPVYGQPSNVITINWNNKTTSPIGTVAFSEENDQYYYFTYTGNVRKDENIEVFCSTSSTFDTNYQEGLHWINESVSSDVDKDFCISKSNLKPGRTYYLKARVRNNSANTTETNTSAYSNVVKFTAGFPVYVVKNSVVTKNSIKMTMKPANFSSSYLSGFEIQRKSKSSWKTISKFSGNTYTDKKLKAFKIYSYRIRPYFYDKDTKKTSYGDWVYNEAMPGWAGTLKLTAKAASKTSAKLTWSKIKGAKGYEIYRLVTNSSGYKVSKGKNDSYTSYKLIKTLGSGKKSYTDKNLTSGMEYEYVVKAYKKVGGKKVYIQDSASVNLDFVLEQINSYKMSNGKVKVSWNPVMSARGYKIEKLNRATDQWTLYKTIKKAKTSSYTFPAATDKEKGDQYRIYAYNGKKSTNLIIVDVTPTLAAPTNVKATVSGNKVTISWKKVSGADYYRVYRSVDPATTQENDLNGYYYYSWSEVGRYVADSSASSGYRWRDLEEMNVTSVVDQEIVYTKNGIANQTLYSGPASGVKYYYFVIAYKKKPQHGYATDNDDSDALGGMPSKAATAMIKEAKPAKPVLSKVSSKKKTVSVSIKGSVKADGYEIYRSTNKKKNFKSVGEITGVSPIYKDKYNKKKNKLKKGKTYYYKVRSFVYNDDGSKVYSAYSSVKKVKFK